MSVTNTVDEVKTSLYVILKMECNYFKLTFFAIDVVEEVDGIFNNTIAYITIIPGNKHESI